MYAPRILCAFFRYSLACSSDQKKTHSVQNGSIILSSSSLDKSISGTKTTGSQLSSFILQHRLLSISISIGREQCAHSVSICTFRYSFRNFPCTKGVANASAAQAAYNCSPVSKVILCGVLSTVTGYAHTTSPFVFLYRNVMRFSK